MCTVRLLTDRTALTVASCADNLNVMEVLASADEAMPALAECLAGIPPINLPQTVSHASAPSAPAAERPVGVLHSTSAPAMLSNPPAASSCVSIPGQPAASELYPVFAPAAALANDHAPTSKQPAFHFQTDQGLISKEEPGKGAGVAEPLLRTVADEASPSQASAPATEPGDGLRARAMSSAALSESPAALAMPAREELGQE